ncbi:dihydrolipoyl dehydrogenase family protein [Desulfocurvus vexinensis]|uniref:dihydrolipoyl dehydrogenase family protein n=1 Tax=Desulfocurvus vexinensis TaxID=399548 RepID=UPI0004906757|nr:FAD-dependent oxidoreductase [Desulfocurvus vexinensis]
MPAFDYDIAIIGGGAAGLSVAAGASRLGARTLLVEREPKLGGDCLHYGCVPSKTLIATAQARQVMAGAERYGLAPVALPPVDFARVRERIASVVADIQRHDSVERFCSLGAEVRFGQAQFIDEHTAEVDDRRVSAAKWVIATGSRAKIPPVPGLALTPHLTNREIFSLERLPERLVVLGGGPVAVELAQAFRRLGSQVEVVQRSGRILTRDDADMAAVVQAALETEGVRLHLGTELVRVQVEGGSVGVAFTQAGQERTVSGDALLVALGRTPNVEGLGLEAAGVAYDAKGIKVDARLRATQKHIFACGDVTGAWQFTHAAGYEAGVVVANAVLRLPRKADYTWMPWCTYTDPALGGVGLTETQARKAGVAFRVVEEHFADNDKARAEGRPEGRVKLLLGSGGKPLGVHVAGAGAGELLSEWAVALAGGVSLARLAGIVHPYPSRGETAKTLAGRLMGETLFSPTVKKALHYVFGLKGRACGQEGDGN